MKLEVLSAKTKIRLGFWNVRTMYETGKLAQVTAEMRRCRLHVLGVSESRWTGTGRMKAVSGETVLYSGRDDRQHREGVAIILKKGAERSLMEWKPIDSRIIKARLKGRHNNITLIQCYAPTNDSEDDLKDNFYLRLQAEIEQVSMQDLIIIMGDLNAKVGADNSGSDRVMGRHGCGTINENGERLVEFCTTNDLVIGGTLFPHREIHKITWCSPNGRDRNQIDHLLINGKWRRSLRDVKVRRGADVGSDHHLVTACLKLKLKSAGRPAKGHSRFDVGQLKQPSVRKSFILEVRNRFEALVEMDEQEDNIDDGVNRNWKNIVTAYSESSKACLGYRQRKPKEWMSHDTWKAIENRRRLKRKVMDSKSQRLKERHQVMYRAANKEVKGRARADKRRYMENLASQAEEAAARNEQGTVYKITKIISGKCHTTNMLVKDKNGTLLTSEREQEMRWMEHFKEVLNRPPPTVVPNIQEATIDLDVNTDVPTRREVIQAINSLKNGKAPGNDNLNAELFKADPGLAATILTPLFTKIWEQEEIPSDWGTGVIIKIPKKGSLSDCNNWRGVTLLSVPSKIFCKVIIQRITKAVDDVLRNEQAGFRKGRRCADQIFTLRNILEQCSEWNRQLYVNFIDYEKAFDSIHRDSLWQILRAYGIPQRIVNIIKCFYSNFTCCVGQGDLSFEIKTGVRQGCVMSSVLFNIAIDWVLRRTMEDQRRGIRWTPFSTLEDLDFADDIALLSHTRQHIQEKTDRLSMFSAQVGLKISLKKTEAMCVNVPSPSKIRVAGQDISYTDKFTYLGSMLCQDGGTGVDIQNRLNKARGAFMSLRPVWRSASYSTKTKLRIYQSCVLSTLLYGCECWRMTERDLSKLASFHTTSLRKILRIFWPQKISNDQLLKQTKQEDIRTIVTRRRWRWIGHVLRKGNNNIARTAMRWTPEGKRRRGRPKTTWRRTVETELRELNYSWSTIEKLARDRQGWRNFVAALCAT